MDSKTIIGKYGENVACEYLKSKNYRIIERNFRQKYGELDIVAKDPANVLVFIEVKTMRQNNSAINNEQNSTIAELKPEDNLTAGKLKKLKRIASLYAGHNQNLINDKKGWRIDLIAINLFENKSTELRHYENL